MSVTSLSAQGSVDNSQSLHNSSNAAFWENKEVQEGGASGGVVLLAVVAGIAGALLFTPGAPLVLLGLLIAGSIIGIIALCGVISKLEAEDSNATTLASSQIFRDTMHCSDNQSDTSTSPSSIPLDTDTQNSQIMGFPSEEEISIVSPKKMEISVPAATTIQDHKFLSRLLATISDLDPESRRRVLREGELPNISRERYNQLMLMSNKDLWQTYCRCLGVYNRTGVIEL